VLKPLRDPRTIKRLQSAVTNVVQTAAYRPQNHLCLGTFQEASLNIIGNARLVSLVGPLVFIRCPAEAEPSSRGKLVLTAMVSADGCERPVALRRRGSRCVMALLFQPPPPPCVKCGTMTLVAPAFEVDQRVFVVRCPACERTYVLARLRPTRVDREVRPSKAEKTSDR
jgi:hypothetical protein